MIMYQEIEVDASIAVIICQMAATSVYVIEALLWIQRTRKNVLTSMNAYNPIKITVPKFAQISTAHTHALAGMDLT
jgi:hypothetical protein